MTPETWVRVPLTVLVRLEDGDSADEARQEIAEMAEWAWPGIEDGGRWIVTIEEGEDR
jgi:hypothetical protein